jgi:hypothetical protein
MESIEKKVFDALTQASYKVWLGGKEFEFRPMSLSDRQEMSVISERIPNMEAKENDSDVFKDSIAAGKYAREIAEIISVGAHVRGWKVSGFKFEVFGLKFWIPCGIATEKARRRKLFLYAYEHATVEEIYEAIKQIFVNSHPAFFLNIITSLCPKNLLKPTKETEATAHGQSKAE